MSLATEAGRHIAAAFSALWVHSREPEHAMNELFEMCQVLPRTLANTNDDAPFLLYQHTPKDGLQRYTGPNTPPAPVGPLNDRGEVVPADTSGISEAIHELVAEEVQRQNLAYGGTKKTNDMRPNVLLAIWHAHLYQDGYVEDFRQTMNLGEQDRIHLIFLSHVIKPLELLRPRMAIIEHELPSREQLASLARETISDEEEGATTDEKSFEATVTAAAGMTRIEAKNAFCLSIHDKSCLDPSVIWARKAEALKTGNKAVELFEGRLANVGGELKMMPLTFKDVGGNAAVKAYLSRMLQSTHTPYLARARGVLLAGVPGTGKTLIAKAVGGEMGWPVLIFYPGRLKGGIQGMAESAMEEFIEKSKRMAPCVVCVDEAEQISIGVASSGVTDGGVKAGLAKRFTQFLEECTAKVYFVLTCNNFPAILKDTPEMIRAGRINRKFFFDYPRKDSRAMVWKIQIIRYGIYLKYATTPEAVMAMTTKELYDFFNLLDKEDNAQWTGAEIEGTCEEADLADQKLDQIAVIPDSEANAEVIEATRQAANGKMFAAEYEGRFEADKHDLRLQQIFGNGSGASRAVRRNKASNN